MEDVEHINDFFMELVELQRKYNLELCSEDMWVNYKKESHNVCYDILEDIYYVRS